MTARTECYGSSQTLVGIRQVIRAFYCMERDAEVTLTLDGETWTVTTHKPIDTVIVWYAKGRYRFGKKEAT